MDGSHLSVILDLSPSGWYQSSQPSPENAQSYTFNTFLSHFWSFVNAHLAQKAENSVAIFGAFPAQSTMLYSTDDDLALGQALPSDANWYLPFKTVDSTVMRRIQDSFEALLKEPPGDESPSALVGALTKALCYINRLVQSNKASKATTGSTAPSRLEPRILVFSVSPDESANYVPLMNAIFSAQKMKIIIDVCQLTGSTTVFLQQAAHLTGGAYLLLEERDAVLEHLVLCFLLSSSLRSIMIVPTSDQVDFRSTCFCHKNIVDIGYVCSVCLSIFCQPVPVCSTCRTKFPLQTLKRFASSKMLTDVSNGILNGKRQTAVPSPNGQRA